MRIVTLVAVLALLAFPGLGGERLRLSKREGS